MINKIVIFVSNWFKGSFSFLFHFLLNHVPLSAVAATSIDDFYLYSVSASFTRRGTWIGTFKGRNNTSHHRQHQLPRLIYRAGFISVAGPLIPLLRWRFTRSTRLAPGVYFDPPVRIPATSNRPMELSPGRELSPLFRCLIAASDCLICSTMWIRSITGRSTRFTLCRELDTRYGID